MSFTTVDMHHTAVGDKLKELTGELFCKKNTGCNNNNSVVCGEVIKFPHCIGDHAKSLATTSRDNQLTLVMHPHCGDDAILVRAELHWNLIDVAMIRQKGPRGEGPV
jgi:hypothetical protein